MHAERITRSKRTVWCCDCDRSLDNPEDIGPINHLALHPTHYVVEADGGDFFVWRCSPEHAPHPR
jgi:hypothetical protein